MAQTSSYYPCPEDVGRITNKEGSRILSEMRTNQEEIRILIEEVRGLIDETILSRKPVLTHKEAAKYLGISVSTLYQKVSQGLVVAQKEPGSKENNYYLRKDLDAYMMSSKDHEVAASDYVIKKSSNNSKKGGRNAS